jgi:hypothetical protein
MDLDMKERVRLMEQGRDMVLYGFLKVISILENGMMIHLMDRVFMCLVMAKDMRVN